MQGPIYTPKHELSTLFISSSGHLYFDIWTIVEGIGQMSPKHSPKWETAIKSKDFAECVLYFVTL